VSKQYQISYLLKAVDQATSTMQAVQKQIDELGKSYDKLTKKKLDLARVGFLNAKTDEQTIKNSRAKVNAKFAEARAEETHATKVKSSIKKIEDSVKRRADQDKKIDRLRIKRIEDLNKENLSSIKEINLSKQRKEAKTSDLRIQKEEIGVKKTLVDLAKKEDSLAYQRSQREQRQQNKSQFKNRREVFDAANSARSAMFYAAAPATAAAIFSLKSAMDLEQQKLNLRTQFGGEEGNKAFVAMKEYAKQTAFSLPEAIQLLSDLKIGQENLGIKTNEELIQRATKLGDILIAFGKNKENRAEISNQLGQVAMAEKASTRQDLRVMQKRGLPVFQALKSYTGMSFSALTDKFGSELPSKLIMNALDHLAKSPQVIRAMAEYSQTLTQAWGAFKEQTQYTAAAYGNILDNQFKIKEKITETTNILSKFEDKMTGVDKTSLSITESAVGFGTAWVIAVPTLLYGALVLKKIHMSMVGAAGGATTFMKYGLAVNGIFSLWMLSTVDFKEMIDDVNENGFGVMANHLDKILITAISLYSVIKAIAAFSGAGAAGAAAGTAAGVGAAGAAAGVAGGAGAYFGTRWILDKVNVGADYEMLRGLGFSQKEARDRAENSQSRIDKVIEESKKTKEFSDEAAKIKNEINLQVNIDKDLNVTASTKTKRDPMQNPVTMNAWSK